MNKIANINLGGYPFTIDEDAYEYLRHYLQTIHQHFEESEGYEEITADIESRMAELFQENAVTRPIISLRDVEDAIAIMGRPEDFGAESMDYDPSTASKSAKSKKRTLKTGKRLFRNPEDEILGGVASGLAAYLGIQDPLWVRLAFLVIAFGLGFGFLFYLVLWAILPKATTASDRLAMRGEPINIDNIGKIIEEEVNRFADKVTDLGDNFKNDKSNKNDKKKSSFRSFEEESIFEEKRSSSNPIRKGVRAIGQIMRTVIFAFLQIWKPILFVLGLILIIAFAMAWLASIIGLFFGFPFLNYLLPGTSELAASVFSINVLFVVGIPLIALVLLTMRIFMRAHIKPVWSVGLWIFFAINFLGIVFQGIRTAQQFEFTADIPATTKAWTPDSDTLSIQFSDTPYDERWSQIGDEVYLSNGYLISEQVDLFVRPSENGDFRIEQKNYSRGGGKDDAAILAAAIDADFELQNSKLTLPGYFRLNEGEKWRSQKINYHLYVPVGKRIYYDDAARTYIHPMSLSQKLKKSGTYRKQKVLEMTDEGLMAVQ